MALERETTQDGFVTEKVDVLKSNLLGEYNAEGKYMISQAIIAELVNIRKYKRNAFNNAVYCVSQSKLVGELLFEIIFKKNTKGQVGSATLSLLEPVKKVNGYVQNTIKTPIGIYRAGISSTFVDDASRAFNVILNMGEGDTYEADKLDEQIFIQAKKDLNKILGAISYSEYNSLYEEYFNKRMEVIKKLDNPFMQEILREFDLEKSKIEQFFLQNDSGMQYKTLNELLDKVMEWYFGISPVNKKYEEEYRNTILPFLRAFILQAGTIEKTAVLDAEKAYPRNKKEVLEKTAQDSQQIKADKTKQNESAKVIDKSPDAQQQAEIKPIVKEEVKKESKSFSELFSEVERNATKLKFVEVERKNKKQNNPTDANSAEKKSAEAEAKRIAAANAAKTLKAAADASEVGPSTVTNEKVKSVINDSNAVDGGFLGTLPEGKKQGASNGSSSTSPPTTGLSLRG